MPCEKYKHSKKENLHLHKSNFMKKNINYLQYLSPPMWEFFLIFFYEKSVLVTNLLKVYQRTFEFPPLVIPFIVKIDVTLRRWFCFLKNMPNLHLCNAKCL